MNESSPSSKITFLSELDENIPYPELVRLAEKYEYKISKEWRGNDFERTSYAAKSEVWFKKTSYGNRNTKDSYKVGFGETLEQATKDAVLRLRKILPTLE